MKEVLSGSFGKEFNMKRKVNEGLYVIGQRVKQARKDKGITQEKLAETIDVTPQFISDMERGIVSMSLSTFRSVCLALDASADYLLFDRVPTPPVSGVDTVNHYVTSRQAELMQQCMDVLNEAFSLQPGNDAN